MCSQVYSSACDIPNPVIFLAWSSPINHHEKDFYFQLQTGDGIYPAGNVSSGTKFSVSPSSLWAPDEVAKYCSNIDRLNKLAELENNWNGYGAKKFSNNLIERIKKIISILEVQPEIFPTGAQSIQLEYENKDSYLEFEIYENGQIKAYREGDKNSEEQLINEADIKIWLENYREK